ncbi:MAG: YjgN family protein [Granulosicoccus sp.]
MESGVNSDHCQVSFTGSGGQYFKIWIVNILLTIVTLYIYSAWAKIRTKRYFHGNTVIDGSSFEYHARPMQILLSRMVAAVLFIAATFGSSFNAVVSLGATVLLILVIPFAIWRSTIFNMRMTSYRNVRFDFDGRVWPLYLYQGLFPLLIYGIGALGVYLWFRSNDLSGHLILPALAAFLLFNLVIGAFTHHRLSQYFLNHYLYGKSRFSGTLVLGTFFRTYLLAALVALTGLVGAFLLWFNLYAPDGINLGEWLKSGFGVPSEESSEEEELAFMFNMASLAIVFYAYLFTVGYFAVALVKAQVRNHVFGRATLDKRITLQSGVSTVRLWWIMFSNMLLLIVSLGLARPFTQVRMARYLADRTSVQSPDTLDSFVAEKRKEVSAFGDELGDAFDADMDVSF